MGAQTYENNGSNSGCPAAGRAGKLRGRSSVSGILRATEIGVYGLGFGPNRQSPAPPAFSRREVLDQELLDGLDT